MNIFIKPAPGLVIRHPFTLEALPAEGLLVEEDNYWRRRLKCGDVVLAKPPAKKKSDK